MHLNRIKRGHLKLVAPEGNDFHIQANRTISDLSNDSLANLAAEQWRSQHYQAREDKTVRSSFCFTLALRKEINGKDQYTVFFFLKPWQIGTSE